ncbi:hypothetical protein psal_cds_1253 [Pandoravirus salinus]|uniref:DUF5860 domain-containing protein n=1 Tax=Pandoravirus salinus TaxID=1349410 RepID=S4VZ08_9VIRU|nr:hypothetical protein psal_cds_1253 [Pandoravirus salinus]AGO85588.1 hypothetical protein psal_cds_1253 [Pandoravirus salinus]
MTCPPTSAIPVPCDPSKLKVASLPADLFTRLYPWMSAGDACLYAAVDRRLAESAETLPRDTNKGILRRQWTAEPLVGADVGTVLVDLGSLVYLVHDDLLVGRIVRGILFDRAAAFDSRTTRGYGHRLVLSIAAGNRREIRFRVEHIRLVVGRPESEHPCGTGLTVLSDGVTRTARQVALAFEVDRGLATVPHDWATPSDTLVDGAVRTPVDQGTIDLHVRYMIAEAHRRGARYASVPGRVTLSIHDAIGTDDRPLLSFIVRHDDDADNDKNGRVSTKAGRTKAARDPLVSQRSADCTSLGGAPSSPHCRRRAQATQWQSIRGTTNEDDDNQSDHAYDTLSDADNDDKETTVRTERRRWVPCGGRALFASHRASPSKHNVDADGSGDDRKNVDAENATLGECENRPGRPKRDDVPSWPKSTTTAAPSTQTAADIIALYPDLTTEQAARVFAASAQLGEVPHTWVAVEAFGRGRCMATSLRACAAAMVRVKADYEDDWHGGRCVVLALGNARDTILYRVVGGAPKARSQTDDDLAALYAHLSPIELVGLCAINRALKDMPRVWVGGGGDRYPHRVSLGHGGPPVTATVEAVRRLCDHAKASHVVLALGRTPTGALTLDYGAVVSHP